MNPRFFGVVCVAVLCVILTLGLWPFYAPKNDVAWLEGTDGLEFGRYGTVHSSGALTTASALHDTGSIEVWLQPDRSRGGTFLAIYQPESHRVLRLQQSLSDFKLEIEGPQDQNQTPKSNLYVDDAFRDTLPEKKPAFITTTYGPHETKIYVDGVLAKTASALVIPHDALAGWIVVGDSPWQPDSFQGRLRALAIYNAELAESQISRHYVSWTKNGRPDVAPDEHALGLYLFDERAGTVIHNRVAAGVDLHIPEDYSVVNKIFLEPFWKEFNLSQTYGKNILINVIGFLPVGFVFYAYFTVARPISRPMLATVVVGAATSLTIEVLQAFLPTRDSGTTDLITNTLGTYLGVLCYRNIYSIVTEKFPWLAWLQAPPCNTTTEPLSETNGKSR